MHATLASLSFLLLVWYVFRLPRDCDRRIRKRKVVVENVTEETAVRMVRNWVEYGAEASEMPEAENVVCHSVEPLSFPSESVLTDTMRMALPSRPS